MTAPVIEDDAIEEPAVNDGAVIPTGFVAQRIERFSIGTRSSLPSARPASRASLPSRSASGTSLPSRSGSESATATASPPHHPMVVNVIAPPQPQPQLPPDGAYPNGAYPDGAYPNGAYPNGAYPNGAYPDGAYSNGDDASAHCRHPRQCRGCRQCECADCIKFINQDM